MFKVVVFKPLSLTHSVMELLAYNLNFYPHRKCGPYALLLSEDRNTIMNPVLLKPTSRFRGAFVDNNPPLRYTRVTHDQLEGTVKRCKQQQRRTVDEIGDTLITESQLDKYVFNKLPPLSKGKAQGYNQWLMVTAGELIDHVFKRDYVMSIAHGIVVDLLKMTNVKGLGYIPLNQDQLFLRFEPILWTEADDADYRFTRQVLVKHAVELVCPFTTVCLEDTADLEKCLALALPMGSRLKGKELYMPLKGGGGSEEDDGQPRKKKTKTSSSKGGCLSVTYPDKPTVYIDTVSGVMSHNSNGEEVLTELTPLDDPVNFLREGNRKSKWKCLAYMAYRYDEAPSYYQKQAVVFSHHRPDDRCGFSIYDYTNYYASVLAAFNLDPFLTECLDLLRSMRTRHPILKLYIVSILGKGKHEDLYRYNILKQLSVAVMLDTVNMNPGVVLGATTDGIMVKNNDPLREFVYPDNLFEVKRENNFSKAVVKHTNHYAGLSADGSGAVHRGCLGKGCAAPKWYKRAFDILLEKCLQVTEEESSPELLESHFKQLDADVNDYLKSLEDTDVLDLFVLSPDPVYSVSPVTTKFPVIYWLVNEMVIHKWQMYSVVDDHITFFHRVSEEEEKESTQAGGVSRVPPATLSAMCLKNIEENKYVSLLDERIVSVSLLFDDHPAVKRACSITRNLVVAFIRDVCPKGQAVYPGGVLTVTNINKQNKEMCV